jgi:hypothetical protein
VIFYACGTRAAGRPQLPPPPAGGERAPAGTGWPRCWHVRCRRHADRGAAHDRVVHITATSRPHCCPAEAASQPAHTDQSGETRREGRRLCEFDGCTRTRLREDRSLRQPGIQHHAIRGRSYTGPVRRLAMRIATLLVLAGTVRGSGACCLLVRGLQIARQHCGYAHCVDDTEQERDLNASALSPRPCPGLFCVGRCLVS